MRYDAEVVYMTVDYHVLPQNPLTHHSKLEHTTTKPHIQTASTHVVVDHRKMTLLLDAFLHEIQSLRHSERTHIYMGAFTMT